jgi:hypothetical protein
MSSVMSSSSLLGKSHIAHHLHCTLIFFALRARQVRALALLEFLKFSDSPAHQFRLIIPVGHVELVHNKCD